MIGIFRTCGHRAIGRYSGETRPDLVYFAFLFCVPKMKGHAAEVDWQVSPVTTHLSFASPFHRSSEASINPPKKKTTPRKDREKVAPFCQSLSESRETQKRSWSLCFGAQSFTPCRVSFWEQSLARSFHTVEGYPHQIPVSFLRTP